MKQAIIVVIAAFFSFGLSEVIVSIVAQYPDYGVLYKVHYRNGGETWTNIHKAHAEIFNVEGKQTIHLNNYGLPGSNIVNLDNPVVLLGSSYVEALQYQPENIASSIVADEITIFDPSYDVVNLGCSGHDPYDSYFRLKFFEQELDMKTEQVILIINSDNKSWFDRHPKPLSFEVPCNFGEHNQSKIVNLQIKLRNMSSLVNLYVNGLLKADEEPLENPENSDVNAREVDPIGIKQPYFGSDLKACLLALNQEYDDFIVVSIYKSEAFDRAMKEFCENNMIDYDYLPLTTPEFLINGAGHLNELGNKALGLALAKYIKKSNRIGV